MNKENDLIFFNIIIFLTILLMSCAPQTTEIYVIDIADVGSSDLNIGVTKIDIIDLMVNTEYPMDLIIIEVKALSIVGWNVNNLSVSNTVELWISEDSTHSNSNDIRENCILVYESPMIQGNDSILVDWSDGMIHIENFSSVREYFRNNDDFFIYVLADNTPFDLSIRLSFVITIIETMML